MRIATSCGSVGNNVLKFLKIWPALVAKGGDRLIGLYYNSKTNIVLVEKARLTFDALI
jgi:hypothetical protein